APHVGPRVTESRGPVLVVSGSNAAPGKVEPAAAVTPAADPPARLPEIPKLPAAAPPAAPAPQPPEKLPAVPQPADPKLPAPQPADPKQPAPGQFPSVEHLSSMGTTDDDYLRALASNQQGFRVRLDQAVGLGLINSREFQDRREDLYLAALPVTLSRYNFAAQAFFTEQVVRDFTGSGRTDAGRLWSLDTNAGFGKNFATGASLLVRLANQVVIDLGSDRPDIAVSTVSLSFLQPFLRGGGLAVNLENLTSNERNMVYAMRSYARFRKIFYVAVAAGGNITNNPYGLQGLSVNLGRGIGGNLTSPVVGYLPLLQQAAAISNQRENVAALERLLRLYQAFREGGQQSDLQVGQVEVDLLNSRAQLLGSARGGQGGAGIRGYLDQLDNFKLQLGLPLTVALDLDDTPLKPIREQLGRFEDLYADLGQLEVVSQQYDPKNPPDQFRPYWRRLLTESELVKGTAFAKGISARWDAWAKLTGDELKARLDALLKERDKLIAERGERQVKNLPEPPAATRRLAEILAELELADLELAVRAYEAKPGPETLQRASVAFVVVALGARNERVAQTRESWPKLPPLPVNGTDLLAVDLDEAYTVGIQAALSSRLDLMNARGQVVDAYRQIAVTANSLQGVFDVGYDFNTTTPPGDNRPFAFNSNRNNHRLTFRAELPLVRRAERNNYRAALIGYQRQKRTLMAFEDNIANDVRADIRELRTQAQLYRISQRAVELAYSQVDNANKLLTEPPAPGAGRDAGSAAALTQQALNNQSRLLAAQNDLYSLWVSYATSRMNLYLDLELMQLDDRGVWTDEQAPGITAPPQPGPAPERERLPAPKPVGAPEGK
ncbi:MAG TPA: TolC family protein, partial [Gemmata sp.]|nr:TolC family protein [Gemmata sp.]